MEHWINLKDYTPIEHILFAIGCLGWVVTYIIVIKKTFKNKYVEIPAFAICANFAWEFLWSWVFKTDMGELYVWGYRVWFFLDCAIVYGMFRYGHKQWSDNYLAENFKPLISFCLACWGISLYFYIYLWGKPFTYMGANSGYILNVMMSLMYPILILKQKEVTAFSLTGAWLKGLGTLLITIFCFVKFPNHYWLLSLGVITAILDAAYIYVYYQKMNNKIIN